MHFFALVIAIMWLGLWIYWILSAFSAKRNTISNMRQFILSRTGIIILALTLIYLFNRLPLSIKNLFPVDNSIILAVAFIGFLFGFLLTIGARIQLGKNWGMPMTEKHDPTLVTTGPYKYIRHPIYTGFLIMSLCSAIDVNYYWMIVFIVAVIFFTFSAEVEEKMMMKKFPKAYPSYRAKTKMFLSFII
jgi:protein-S-isoprenylcysteine O-methyltransferase Ste14